MKLTVLFFSLLFVSVSFGDSGRLVVTLRSGEYDIEQLDGVSRILMEGFNSRSDPGMPILPWGTSHFLLPPGARAVSVEVLSADSEELEGEYELPNSSGFYILDGYGRSSIQQRNVELNSLLTDRILEAEGSTESYPTSIVKLSGVGTLREYSYATLSFCPFTYTAGSNRLIHNDEVTVAINYTMAGPREFGADNIGSFSEDPQTILYAEELFTNYQDFKHMYDSRQPEVLGDVYDYVIITTEELVSAIESSGFVNWKSQLGYSVKTVLVSDAEIVEQSGDDLPEKIRNFLRSSYGPWGIKYVLFVGDWETVPMKICYPDPNFHVYNPSNPGLVAPGTPTDAYYADLSYSDEESWDLDGDGFDGEFGEDLPDFQSEVSVGRIPVNSPAEITDVLSRTMLFEQDSGDWKKNVLHVGTILFFENQNHGGGPLVDGAVLLDSMETGLMTGMNITHMSEQYGLQKSLFQWQPVSQAAFSNGWRSGKFSVVNWSGHGWPNGAARSVWAWDDGDGVPESAYGEINSLYFINVESTDLEDDYPSVVFAISCDVGYPEPNQWGNAGIDLLCRSDWGSSVAVLSATRPAAVSGDWINEPGGTEQICYEFNRYLIQECNTTGDALYNGKFYATSEYGWDYMYEYVNLFNYNLYGDPSLILAGFSTGIDDEQGEYSYPELTVTGSNPLYSSTSLQFSLPADGNVKISVFDITGRRVANLLDSFNSRGSYELIWNGTNENGEHLPSGTYLITAEIDDYTVSQKLVLLR